MIALDMKEMSHEGQAALFKLLEVEGVDYFMGNSFKLYLRDSIRDNYHNLEYDYEFIDKHSKEVEKYIEALADNDEVSDRRFLEDIRDEVEMYYISKYVIDEVKEMLSSGILKSDKITLTVDSTGLINCYLKGQGWANIEVLRKELYL